MEGDAHPGLREGLEAAMAGREMMTAAAPEEMAAAVEGFEKTTVAGLPVGRGLDEVMTAGAEVMMLSVEGLAIGSVAGVATVTGPETVSDSAPAPDPQAPSMGDCPAVHKGIVRVIQTHSPQVLSTPLLGITRYPVEKMCCNVEGNSLSIASMYVVLLSVQDHAF